MSLSLTSTEVLAQVSLVSPFPTFTGTTNPTLTEVQTFLEDACRTLSAKLNQQVNDDVLTFSGSLTTTANVGEVSLSTLGRDCLFVRKVEWVKSSTESVDLEKASIDDWRSRMPTGWPDTGPKYRIVRNAIRFFPPPNAAHEVSVTFAGNLSLASDVVTEEVRPGWKEWLTYDVCRRLEQRFGDPSKSTYWERQRDAVWEDVIVPQQPRDDWGIETVRDLRCDWDPYEETMGWR